MIYLRYILCLPLSFLITFVCWWTNPIACLFVKRTDCGDKLFGIFNLWSTNDHYVDEYYYGNYDTDKPTQAVYDNTAWIRYKYRLIWLNRNTGYGWTYLLLSIKHGTGFQFKGQTKPLLGFYNDYNVGYKSHDGIENDIYAARIIGIRKSKT